LSARRAPNQQTAYSPARSPILSLVGQRHAAGSYAMKVLRLIERIAHWIALFLGIVAIVAVGVIIGRPSEESGNQPNFAGAEQQQKRLAVFLDGT